MSSETEDSTESTVARLQRDYNDQIKELQEKQKELESRWETMSKQEQKVVTKPVVKNYDDPLTYLEGLAG